MDIKVIKGSTTVRSIGAYHSSVRLLGHGQGHSRSEGNRIIIIANPVI